MMQSATQQRVSCCHVLYSLPVRRPLRLQSDGRRLTSATERYRCGKHAHVCHVMAYNPQQPTQQAREQVSLVVRQPAFVIARSQLAGKQVVTRTDGRILGVVDGLVADPETCKVVAVSLSRTSSALPGEEQQQIGLMSLKQISDVLLVHDERALLREQLTMGLPYIQLVGKPVKTADGKLVGKVRDFEFSPDDGRITQLVIDALGIPAVPRKLLACQGVSMQLVQRATWNCITLAPGAEANIEKLTTGIFDSAINLLKRSVPFISLEAGDGDVDDNPGYTNWWIDHSQQYEMYSGKRMPRPSDAALQAAMAARQQAQPQSPRTPQALPPGRQATYASQLQPQMPSAVRQMQPEPASWQQANPPLQSQQQSQDAYSNWQQQQPEPQQAQRAGQAQQQFPDQQAWRQPQTNGSLQFSGRREDEQWQDSQPDTGNFQRPGTSSLSSRQDRQSPKETSTLRYRSQQQEQAPQQQWQQQQQQQQQQQPDFDQRQQAGMPQASSYAGSARKVEQQRRFAARQTAGVQEPRFDPRRRRSSSPAPSATPGQSASMPQRQTQPSQQSFSSASSMPSQSATPQQRQAQRFQQTDPAVDRAESDVGFPETYSSLAGPQQQSLGQSYTASKSAAAVLKGPAQGSSESGQGYGGSLEQQNWNGVQPSKSPQEASTFQAGSRSQQYSGWTQQAPAASVKAVAASPEGSIDIA